MAGQRPMVQDSLGLVRNARSGDNTMMCYAATKIATDTNQTLAAAAMAGGIVQFTGFTAGRTVTTDTAANLLTNLMPNADIGDSIVVFISVSPAFAATWAAGTGVTLTGKATAAASSFAPVLITKLSVTTIEFNQL